MNWVRIFGKLQASLAIMRGKVQPSFSQAGEDQVIRYLINDCLKIPDPTYLEIGTHHPLYGNNTYYFYSRGCKGVCVEPDVRWAPLIRKYRKRDVFLQAGVSTSKETSATFYIFPTGYSGWNTLEKEEAENRQAQTNIKFQEVTVPLVNINDIIRDHFPTWPTIISIDVEGLDLDILKSMDFDKYKPEIICAESITFSTTNDQSKINDIAAFMLSKGYFVFADTYVNTIFCKSEAFKTLAS
ncbi:MAG: FkbM family methyltransferase [Chitinophagaceae bacterium]